MSNKGYNFGHFIVQIISVSIYRISIVMSYQCITTLPNDLTRVNIYIFCKF